LTFRPHESEENWILGSPFLRAYFSIYDLTGEKPRIGLVGGGLPAGVGMGKVGEKKYSIKVMTSMILCSIVIALTMILVF